MEKIITFMLFFGGIGIGGFLPLTLYHIDQRFGVLISFIIFLSFDILMLTLIYWITQTFKALKAFIGGLGIGILVAVIIYINQNYDKLFEMIKYYFGNK
jgi:hypothetical protein